MSAVDEQFPERGEPSEWVELNGEETRCLLGLKAYYIINTEASEQVALTKAWADLKTEFERLGPYPWYK